MAERRRRGRAGGRDRRAQPRAALLPARVGRPPRPRHRPARRARRAPRLRRRRGGRRRSVDRRPGADRRRVGPAPSGGSRRPRRVWPRSSPAATPRSPAKSWRCARGSTSTRDGRARPRCRSWSRSTPRSPSCPATRRRPRWPNASRSCAGCATASPRRRAPRSGPNRSATPSGRRPSSRSDGSRPRSGLGRRRCRDRPASSAASTASSSSTTSPFIRTAAWRSNGVRLWVTIAIWPPFDSVVSGSCATGYTSSEEPMHSIRSAPAASASARVSASTGRYSPNSTTSGLERRATVAPGHPVRGPLGRGAHVFQFIPWTTDKTGRMGDRAVHLDQVLRPGPLVQPVDVLGDHRVEQPGPLELDERGVRAVRLLVPERLEALAVEAPEPLRVAAEGVDVGDLHRIDVGPQPGSRRAEIGDSRRHRDPGAGQRHDRVGLADQAREPGRGGLRRAHSPRNRALRFWTNAEIPSRASSEKNT